MTALTRLRLPKSGTALTLLVIAGLSAPAAAQHAFEPFSPRSVARFLGIGSGPGYHAYPCQPFLAQHYNAVASGQMTPQAYAAMRRQTPMVCQVPPVRVGGMPAYTGCGCDNYGAGQPPGSYGHGAPAMGVGCEGNGCAGNGCAGNGFGGGHVETAPSPEATEILAPTEETGPAKLEGTIEPLPTSRPSTRAQQGSTAPKEEATRAPAEAELPKPPQTGSPTQYDPLGQPEGAPDSSVDLRRQLDLVAPEASQQLLRPGAETGSADPKIWW